MKYFMKREILNNNAGTLNTIKMDYPVFFACTGEERERIQRNFADATLKGFNDHFRKVCATLACREGYTVRELIEKMEIVPEVSEEEYNLVIDIPHWNPIKQLDITLIDYTSAIAQAYKESESDGSNEVYEDLIEKYTAEIAEKSQLADKGLPDGKYTR